MDAENHGTPSSSNSAEAALLACTTRTNPFPIPVFLKQYGQTRVAAVYGVYDTQKKLRYIGVTRNVAVSLTSHLQAQGAETVASVALQTFRFPKREEMAQVQAAWLAELQMAGVEIPEGNQDEGNNDSKKWAKSIKEAVESSGGGAMGGTYEETKVKLRTAMADPTLADELDDLDEEDEYGEEAEEVRMQRRAQLKKAVEESDWSGVVDAQTKATVVGAPPSQTQTQTQGGGQIESPFDSSSPSSSSSSTTTTSSTPTTLTSGDVPLDLTPENVDKVLDEVRPYLISDGGNIEILRIDVETRNIYLRLQGACGSCPSSTTTMKMGVERVLREKFASLGSIEAVSEAPPLDEETGEFFHAF